MLFLTGTLVTPRDYHYPEMKFVSAYVFMCLPGVNYSCPCIRTRVFSFGTFMNVLRSSLPLLGCQDEDEDAVGVVGRVGKRYRCQRRFRQFKRELARPMWPSQ